MRKLWQAGLVLSVLLQTACGSLTPLASWAPTPQLGAMASAPGGANTDEAAAEQREAEPRGDLVNFQELEPGLFRSARPSEKGMNRLQAMGIKTIINFEGRLVQSKVNQELAMAKKLGINVIRMPMSPVWPPSAAFVDTFLKRAQDPALRPLLFHCKLGQDRTGTMAYVYRVSVQRWAADKAMAEMEAKGFNNIWVGLWGFVKHYGKKNAPQANPVAALPH